MSHKLRSVLLAAVAMLVVAGAVMMACQGHQFEPVVPKAVVAMNESKVVVQLAPAKVMLVIDKSGSMKTKVDSNSFDGGCCTTAAGSTCTGYNPSGECKWNKLLEVLKQGGGLLVPSNSSEAPVARFGLAVFPSPTASNASIEEACKMGEILEEVGSAPSLNAVNKVLSDLTGIEPQGGTPSASMLAAVLNDADFMKDEANTKRFVVLMTDGLPNCNGSLSPQTCTCTTTNCQNTPTACLDDQRMVESITNLKNQGVETFVVGIGKDMGGTIAHDVLNNAATAGGQAQSGDIKYLPVTTPEDFAKVLSTIRNVIVQCEQDLPEAPQDLKLFEVDLADKKDNTEKKLVKGTDWDFKENTGNKTIKILDSTCNYLKQSEPGRFELKFFNARSL